jgi:hypothetical protein
MRIELRDEHGERLGRVEVDPAQRPTKAAIHGTQREAFLTWEASMDDAGQLRRCVACGCPDLFVERAFPQATGLVVLLAFAGAAVGALGLATPPVLAGMIVVLVIDVAILVRARRRLVCYRCRSSYHELPIARYHRPWDRAMADRHAPPARSTDQAAATQGSAMPSATATGSSATASGAGGVA